MDKVEGFRKMKIMPLPVLKDSVQQKFNERSVSNVNKTLI